MSIFKLREAGVIGIIQLLLIIVGIVAGVYLVQKEGFQIFKSKASAKNIEILSGDCVKDKDGNKILTCEQFKFKVVSPLEAGN